MAYRATLAKTVFLCASLDFPLHGPYSLEVNRIDGTDRTIFFHTTTSPQSIFNFLQSLRELPRRSGLALSFGRSWVNVEN
jgi:hypothetical protein